MLKLQVGQLKKSLIVRVLLLQPKRCLHILMGDIRLFFIFERWVYKLPPVNTIFWVNTAQIIWHTSHCSYPTQEPRNQHFHMLKDKGRVIDGNWDSNVYKYEELAAFIAIRDRVSNKTPWENTIFFCESMRDIDAGKYLWKCHNETELLKRLSLIDDIINDVKLNGYKAGYESILPNEDQSMLSKHIKYSEEIAVNIGRDGEFYFQDGRHRLAIAKALGIEKIPVKILVRHKKWCEKLKTITTQYAKQKGLLDHPDIQYLMKQGILK